MKIIYDKISLKSVLLLNFLLLSSVPVFSFIGNSGDSIKKIAITDSLKLRRPEAREVITKSELVVVKLKKNSKLKPTPKYGVEWEIEARDFFQVISYVGDSSVVEQDWILCPKGSCPEMGVFNYGTKEYNKIDELILGAKENLKLGRKSWDLEFIRQLNLMTSILAGQEVKALLIPGIL